MKIADIRAWPVSFPLPPGGPRIGVGQAVRRDAVMVKVTAEDGIVGWRESHHGRAHTAVARLIETTLRGLIPGMEAVRKHFSDGPSADRGPRFRLNGPASERAYV